MIYFYQQITFLVIKNQTKIPNKNVGKSWRGLVYNVKTVIMANYKQINISNLTHPATQYCYKIKKPGYNIPNYDLSWSSQSINGFVKELLYLFFLHSQYSSGGISANVWLLPSGIKNKLKADQK